MMLRRTELTIDQIPLAHWRLVDCPFDIPPDFVSDGCTGCPDRLFGVDIRAACFVHDWEYEVGGNEADRLKADLRFYRNLRRLGLDRHAAGIMYRRVRLWGCLFFNWQPDRPRGWRAVAKFLRLFVSRYRTPVLESA